MITFYQQAIVNGKRMQKHRFLYEQYHKCCVLRWIDIHHINEDKRDNRIENLLPVTKLEHRRIHNSGKPLSDETRRKISLSSLGKKMSDEARRKMSEHNRGNTYTRGKKHSLESRMKMSKSMKGRIPWNKGKRMS